MIYTLQDFVFFDLSGPTSAAKKSFFKHACIQTAHLTSTAHKAGVRARARLALDLETLLVALLFSTSVGGSRGSPLSAN